VGNVAHRKNMQHRRYNAEEKPQNKELNGSLVDGVSEAIISLR
jgi:hypothetical protein